MTDSPTYPKPQGDDEDRLSDAAWDLRDYGECRIPNGEDPDQWLYWLRRHQGFAQEEIELGEQGKYTFQIKVKD